MSKAALVEAVWPDTAVMDNSLAQCVAELRRALGDNSRQIIQTVARRGYLFAAPVTRPIEFSGHDSRTALGPAAVSLRGEGTRFRGRWIIAGTAPLLVAAAVLGFMRSNRLTPRQKDYSQITNFTDSAVSPALSPDGRMVAFLRSDRWFLSTDQVWLKLLPYGEPIQITQDRRQKYGLAFSPDGSKIAYTAVRAGAWETYIVSPLGGEPHVLLSNSAGLTWLDERRLLFSEISAGNHMGVVSATENRSEYRKIYFPQDERGMAHLSYASPDHKWALVVEMNPVWQPCRLIPLDGSSAGRQVGPRGKCTSAAWSPDGKWMYFGADVEGQQSSVAAAVPCRSARTDDLWSNR